MKGWDGEFDDDAWLEQSLLRTIRDRRRGEGRGFTKKMNDKGRGVVLGKVCFNVTQIVFNTFCQEFDRRRRRFNKVLPLKPFWRGDALPKSLGDPTSAPAKLSCEWQSTSPDLR